MKMSLKSDANCDTGSGIIILLGHCKKSCSCIRQTKGDQIHPLAQLFYQILNFVIECFMYWINTLSFSFPNSRKPKGNKTEIAHLFHLNFWVFSLCEFFEKY